LARHHSAGTYASGIDDSPRHGQELERTTGLALLLEQLRPEGEPADERSSRVHAVLKHVDSRLGSERPPANPAAPTATYRLRAFKAEK